MIQEKNRNWIESWPIVETLLNWMLTKKRGPVKIWGKALMCEVGPLVLPHREAKAHWRYSHAVANIGTFSCGRALIRKVLLGVYNTRLFRIVTETI